MKKLQRISSSAVLTAEELNEGGKEVLPVGTIGVGLPVRGGSDRWSEYDRLSEVELSQLLAQERRSWQVRI